MEADGALLLLQEGELPSGGALEKLVANLQQQRARQLKRMQQLQAQHLARLAKERELAERQQREQERQRELAQSRQDHLEASQRRAAIAELRRKEKLAAVQSREEEQRRRAAAKLVQVEQRVQTVQFERQEVASMQRVRHALDAQNKMAAVRLRASMEEQEKQVHMAQRQARHQQAVQKALEEKRAAEAARKAEEERREAARRQHLARVEQDELERAVYYHQRQQQKEAELAQRNAELAELRALKQHERQMRTAYAKHRKELAAQREEEWRQQLTSKWAAKQQRVVAMEAERAAMLQALDAMRREIQAQEAHLKRALEQMAHKGNSDDLESQLGDLQRQFSELMRPGSGGSILSGSRPASGSRSPAARLAARTAAPAPAAPVYISGAEAEEEAEEEEQTEATLGGRESPRIPAAYQYQLEQPDEAAASGYAVAAQPAAEAGCSCAGSLQSRGTSRAGSPPRAQPAGFRVRDPSQHQQEQQEMQYHTVPVLLPSAAREKLQQILEAELAREAEREVMLRDVADDGDRQRLLHFFELERQNVIELMQQLRAMC